MNLTSLIKFVLAVLLLVCLLDMPYGYYQLVRFIGLIGFGLFAFRAYNRQDNTYFIIWLASAILINPIFKISLGRDIWNIVDVIWAIGLLISIKTEKLSK